MVSQNSAPRRKQACPPERNAVCMRRVLLLKPSRVAELKQENAALRERLGGYDDELANLRKQLTEANALAHVHVHAHVHVPPIDLQKEHIPQVVKDVEQDPSESKPVDRRKRSVEFSVPQKTPSIGIPPLQQMNSFSKLREGISFYFLSADAVRTSNWKTLPRMQDLKRSEPHVLVEEMITLQGALGGEYEETHLAVSHRWELRNTPDEDGSQMREVRRYLHKHKRITHVWIDYCCMPQAGPDENGDMMERTEPEQQYFERVLSLVNLLYLSMKVLLLVDLTYKSRFWTCYEAWLSMRQITADGLRPSPHALERFEIKCLHNADAHVKTLLEELLLRKTSEEIGQMLRKPDITVTNQSDKETQLLKLQQLTKAIESELSANPDLLRDNKELRKQASKKKLERKIDELRGKASPRHFAAALMPSQGQASHKMRSKSLDVKSSSALFATRASGADSADLLQPRAGKPWAPHATLANFAAHFHLPHHRHNPVTRHATDPLEGTVESVQV